MNEIKFVDIQIKVSVYGQCIEQVYTIWGSKLF